MISDGMSDPSSPESTFDTSDIIMSDAITDDVTTQLAAAGMYNMLWGYREADLGLCFRLRKLLVFS